ncbi:MAG: DUF427 domain-containing protein [Pirellulaceae bacterium]
MPRAIWNNTVIANSDQTVVVDGNHYFPADSLVDEHFQPSETTSVCGWKGTANYYDVVVDGKVNAGAAWYYAAPKPEASQLQNHVAFWKGVEVQS